MLNSYNRLKEGCPYLGKLSMDCGCKDRIELRVKAIIGKSTIRDRSIDNLGSIMFSFDFYFRFKFLATTPIFMVT